MFPVSDVIPSRKLPVVTLGLIALHTAAFAYELTLDASGVESLYGAAGVTPATFWWPTLLTYSILHAGWLHAGPNLLYLWLFGPNVEDAFGRGYFLIFYLACSAIAAAAQIAMQPWSAVPLIGASGAVAGVMGAYLVLYPRSRILTFMVAIVHLDVVEVPALFFLGIWFLLQLLSNLAGLGVDAVDGATGFWAHVAGLGLGIVCGAYARFRAAALSRYWRGARR
jgi:membrane associated rhomboid family serine protease